MHSLGYAPAIETFLRGRFRPEADIAMMGTNGSTVEAK